MLQIVGVSVICATIVLYLKNEKSELTVPALVCSGVLILSFSIKYVSDALGFFNELKSLTGIDENFVVIMGKITAIGYLVEFAASTIEDFGLKSLSDKLVFVGKMIIISVSLPVLYSVINVIKVMLV